MSSLRKRLPRNVVAPALVLAMITAGLLIPNSAAEPTAVTFEDLDRTSVGDDVYGMDRMLLVHVTDVARADIDELSVRVWSQSDATGESIPVFNAGSGEFYGTFGFEANRQSDNGRVAVDDGDTVTVETDAVTNEITWRTARTASIGLDASVYRGEGAVASITVTDNDVATNTDATSKDTVDVHVASDSDSNQGIGVTLEETGANTGVFRGTFSFDPIASDDSADEIHVQDGDTITVNLTDPADSSGARKEVEATAAWELTQTASIHLLDNAYQSAPATYAGTGDELGFIRVHDPDRRGAVVINAKASSNTDSIGIAVLLTETGAQTGEFIGSFGFTTGSSSTTDRLRVSPQGDTIHATYTDPLAQDGTSATVETGTADNGIDVPWQVSHDSTIALFREPTYTTAADLHGQEAGGFIRVQDEDLNQDSTSIEAAVVWVTSDRDPVGVAVTLQETGPDTGIFQGGNEDSGSPSFNISNERSKPETTDPARIWVLDGDTITVTYLDAMRADGAKNVTVTDEHEWHSSHTADLRLDRGPSETYYGISEGFGTARTPVATIWLHDSDRDVDPAAKDSATVTVTSGKDTTGFTVTLTEVEESAGVFRGSFGFTGGASSETSDLLAVDTNAGTDTITVTYDEARDVSGKDPGVVTATSGWTEVPASAVIEVDTTSYNGTSRTGTVVVYDADAVPVEGSIDVSIISATPPTSATAGDEELVIAATETTDGSGVFKGTYQFSTSVHSGKVSVKGTGSLLDFTAEGVTENGLARWGPSSTAELTLLDSTFTTPVTEYHDDADPLALQVTDPDANLDTDLPDVIEIRLQGEETETASLIETGSDTGIFRGAIPFEATINSANGRIAVGAGEDATILYPSTASTDASAEASETATWNPAGTADLFADSDFQTPATTYHGIGSALAFVQVTDAFYNTDETTSETLDAYVGSSATDRLAWNIAGDLTGGITIELKETAPDTGIFQGTFGFSEVSDDAAAKLGIRDGGTVTLAWGHGSPVTDRVAHATAAYQETVAGTIQFLEPDGASATSSYAGLIEGRVQVRDDDRLADPTVESDGLTVTLKSNSDPTGITLELQETFGRHGPWSDGGFEATFFFSTEASSIEDRRLKVRDGDDIQALYTDAFGAEGQEYVTAAAATWSQAHTADLQFTEEAYLGETHTPTIRINEGDQNTNAGAVESFDVHVTSDTDPTGIDVPVFETGADTGVFEGTIEFSKDSSGASKIHVQDGDQIRVNYTDTYTENGMENVDSFDVATWWAEGHAVLSLDQSEYSTLEEAAVLTLDDQDLDVTLSADRVVVKVFSEYDVLGERIELTETGGTTGIFQGQVGFESGISDSNGKVAVSDGTRLFAYHYDSNPAGARMAEAIWHSNPNAAPTATLAASVTNGNVPFDVTFTVGGSDSDGTIESWVLAFGDGEQSVGASTPTGTVEHTYEVAGDFEATLTVTDDRGAAAQAVVAIDSVSTDTTAPSGVAELAVVDDAALADSIHLQWIAPGDDEDTGNVSGYRIRYSQSAIDTAADYDSATTATDVTFIPSTLVEAGEQQEAVIAGLQSGTMYNVTVRAVDEAGNLGPLVNAVSATTTTIDDTAPVGALTITSSTHQLGVPTPLDDPEFNWTGLSDPQSSIRYHYALNQITDYVIDGTETLNTTETKASFANVADGTWHFHVAGMSQGGLSDTAHYTILIEAPSETQNTDDPPSELEIRAANLRIDMEVKRQDETNVVSWTLPDDLPATPAGVQVWRANSPYEMIAEVTEGFTDGDYTDDSDAAREDSRYLVTVFYESGLGLYTESDAPSNEQYAGMTASTATSTLSVPGWAIAVATAAVLVVISVIIAGVVIVRRHQGTGSREEDEEDDWGFDENGWEPEQEETDDELDESEPVTEPHPTTWQDQDTPATMSHGLLCPNCSTQFTATGERPIRMDCPGCGKTGILR